MSDAAQEKSNPQRLQQFVHLLPLTLAIAGLSQSEPGKYFNEDQLEIRARTIKNAYRHARRVAREISQE